jgi:rhodanese-related sulfurtransferase
MLEHVSTTWPNLASCHPSPAGRAGRRNAGHLIGRKDPDCGKSADLPSIVDIVPPACGTRRSDRRMNRPQGIPALDPLYADIRRNDPLRPAVLLDIRELDEFTQVRVEGSLFIPMSQLGARLFEVPKDRPILVICASGSRSQSVTSHLLASGWTDVGSVAGGISTWERMGLPVRRGPVQAGEGRLDS